ncbi:Peroxisome biogenesis protein 3-1 [Thalictrum thalictroides]|uniref:Peroxisome biogenesis protein 3-1 n=1 Tax=Thalictrum thalictroides TaxID=46969 RepID=A0A7J6VA96_THATH|nr:Peroxisome biogenesis protein 3-1 [Thalictrum thalictroides]
MLSLRNFWRRNKRKVFVTVGVLGSGYVIYKLYGAHRQRLLDLDKELEREREADELIKSQLQTHFENIQRIVDSTTLPYAMYYLRNRISEDLDLSYLTNRLNQVKDLRMTKLEKLELWENLKVLSFTKMVLSLWSMTALNLYIRIQVNILGRHLYIDAARGMETPHLMEEVDQFDRHGQQEFLATADYLSNYGIVRLIPNMRTAATEVLKGKQLTDTFNTSTLQETIMQILNTFKTIGGFHDWVAYLIPENGLSYKQSVVAYTKDDDTSLLPNVSKLEQLILEARAVLMSADFGDVMEISLRSVVDALMEDFGLQSGGSQSSGIPLARLLARVAQTGPTLLEEPSKNRFIQIIQSLPEVELFYTLLYTNMPLQFSDNT